jgi:hypothetical protein
MEGAVGGGIALRFRESPMFQLELIVTVFRVEAQTEQETN